MSIQMEFKIPNLTEWQERWFPGGSVESKAGEIRINDEAGDVVACFVPNKGGDIYKWPRCPKKAYIELLQLVVDANDIDPFDEMCERLLALNGFCQVHRSIQGPSGLGYVSLLTRSICTGLLQRGVNAEALVIIAEYLNRE